MARWSRSTARRPSAHASTTIEDPPQSLLCDGYPPFPLTYFVLFRNERGMPTPPEVWPFVRKRWPVLEARSDEELYEALAPITDVYIDNRFV